MSTRSAYERGELEKRKRQAAAEAALAAAPLPSLAQLAPAALAPNDNTAESGTRHEPEAERQGTGLAR